MASFKYRVWAKVDLGRLSGWRPDVFVGLYELSAPGGARPIAVAEFADDIVGSLRGDQGTVEAAEPHLGELMVLIIDGARTCQRLCAPT